VRLCGTREREHSGDGRVQCPEIDEFGERGHRKRTFARRSRRFRDEVGTSPGRWLIQQRIFGELLESTDMTVDRIAGEVGFATGTSLRQHVHDSIGVSPLAYRRAFRADADPLG
jgi:transcriptional regulator GlxA family with amidase domain